LSDKIETMTLEQRSAAARRAIKWELLAGLFGWMWIIGGFAGLVLAGFAIFSNGSWWNVGYAFIVSAIGKWLARGFIDNKRRVFFEAEMMARGMTAKEAGDAWTQTYLKS